MGQVIRKSTQLPERLDLIGLFLMVELAFILKMKWTFEIWRKWDWKF